MKTRLLFSILLAIGLTACASTSANPSAEAQTAPSGFQSKAQNQLAAVQAKVETAAKTGFAAYCTQPYAQRLAEHQWLLAAAKLPEIVPLLVACPGDPVMQPASP